MADDFNKKKQGKGKCVQVEAYRVRSLQAVQF